MSKSFASKRSTKAGIRSSSPNTELALKDEEAIPSWMSKSTDGYIVRFYAQPQASISEIVGVYGEGSESRLKIRISAPPVDGAANQELVRFLKKAIGIPLSQIKLIRGETSRSKDVLFVNVNAKRVIESLGME